MQDITCKKHYGFKQRILYALLLCFGAFIGVCAQLPHDFRSEQIYLGVARTEWSVNDTIELDGVVTCMSNANMRPYSRYIYVELLDTADSVLVRQKVACGEDGTFRASIPTLSVYKEGVHYLRAYTNLMRNFSGESFAMQPILIGKTFPERVHNIGSSVQCGIYPGGGFLVSDNIQDITVALTDKLGDALGGKAVSVVDDNGNIVCEGRTRRSGLLSLKFIPQAGRQYRVAVSGRDNAPSYFDVPQARSDSMKLQCVLSGGRLKFEVLNASGDLSFNRLCFYSNESGLVGLGGARPSGVVPLSVSPRIVTMFLTDSIGNVLSEATAMARYTMGDIPQTPDTIKASYAASLADSLSVSSGKRVLVRFAEAGERWASFAESDLRYLSDYGSPLPFPEAFFAEDTKERAADLQVWLATATFKRFGIADAISKDTAMYVRMPETNMTFCGIVQNEERMRRPLGRGTLVAYNTGNNCVYDVPIGKDGRFRMAVDDFANGTTFYLQTMDRLDKPVGAYIAVDDETYPPVATHRRYELQMPEYAESRVTIEGTMSGRVLPDVVVKAQVHHDEPVSREKFYSTSYADREKIEKHACITLLDILKTIPAVIVKSYYNEDTHRMEYQILTRRMASTLSGGSIPILLDGIRIDSDMVDNTLGMPADDIEEVEVLQAWQTLAYVGWAIDGAVRVVTRSPNKLSKVRSMGTFYTPMGLTEYSGRPTTVSPGRYRLLLDVVSPDGVVSCERNIVVTE